MKKIWILSVSFLLIVILLFRIWETTKEIKILVPEIKILKKEFPNLNFPSSENEFISPDRKLKLRYSSEWIKIENFEELTFLSPGKILLFLFNFTPSKLNPSFFIVEVFEEENLEKIIQEMEEKDKIEFITLEKKDKELYFQGRQKSGKENIFLEGKIFFLDEKIYRLTGFSFEKDWSFYEEKIKRIINSIQVIE